MDCEMVDRIISGELLPEEAGGARALQEHADGCAACRMGIRDYLADENLLQSVLVRKEAEAILRQVSRRRRRSFGLGVAAGIAVAAILAGLLSNGSLPASAKDWKVADNRFQLPGRVDARLRGGVARVVGPDTLELSEGRLDVKVTPGLGGFSVATPAGTVRVRGTEFTVLAYRDRRGGGWMNRPFLSGAAIGAVTVVAVYSGSVTLFGGGRAEPVGPGQVASVRGGEIPEAAHDWAGRLAGLEAQLSIARQEAAEARSERDAGKAWANRLSETLKKLAEENAALKERIGPILDQDPESEEARHLTALRERLRVGEDLPRAVVDWLGLTAGIEAQVNQFWRQEKTSIFAALRQLASDPPALSLPAEDGAGVFTAFFPDLASLWEKLPEDVRNRLPSAPKDAKPVYLSDYVDPNHRGLRVFQAIVNARNQTLESVRTILTPDQNRKLADLIRFDFRFEDMLLAGPPESLKLQRPK